MKTRLSAQCEMNQVTCPTPIYCYLGYLQEEKTSRPKATKQQRLDDKTPAEKKGKNRKQSGIQIGCDR